MRYLKGIRTTSPLWRHLLLLSLVLLGSGSVHADDDHERARQLREAGGSCPWKPILTQVRARGDTGRVLEVELKNKHGRYVYEIEMLDAQGRVRERLFDAQSGRQVEPRKVDD